MALEEVLARIITQKKSMTSQNLAETIIVNGMEKISKLSIKYKCEVCRDTSWVLGTTGYRRCECYEIDYIKRLWENYGVKPDEVKKLKEYKPYDIATTSLKNKASKYITSFNEISNTRENSFGIFGQSGAGKSHVSIAIGAALLREKRKVVYMPYLEVMRELKSNAMDDEHYIKIQSKLQKAELLIIDDLFKDKVTGGGLTGKISEADMKHIYPILNYRYLNKLPMVVSSECTPLMLNRLDEALAGRIIESCGDNVIEFKGKNYNYRMRRYIKE